MLNKIIIFNLFVLVFSVKGYSEKSRDIIENNLFLRYHIIDAMDELQRDNVPNLYKESVVINLIQCLKHKTIFKEDLKQILIETMEINKQAKTFIHELSNRSITLIHRAHYSFAIKFYEDLFNDERLNLNEKTDK